MPWWKKFYFPVMQAVASTRSPGVMLLVGFALFALFALFVLS